MTDMELPRRGFPWRLIGWGAMGGILLLPLVAGAPWTIGDYIAAGMMLTITGLLIELAVHTSSNLFYRGGAGMAVLAGLLLFWVNGAVGFLGDEHNDWNLLFFGVVGVAVAGSALSGFRARGMSIAMLFTAGVQLAIGVAALIFPLGSPGKAGVFEAVIGTAMFCTLWLVSATLLRRAASS